MPVSELDWRLLKSVSRSFYLTLCLLPKEVREPISLAYLLARLSDTKADGAVSPGERELLAREAELLHLLARSADREEITRVWQTIQSGQEFDRVRFEESSTPLTPEELDNYTYMVAGCVGEFWTRICSMHLKRFATRDQEEMTAMGIRFGKGLQLINILRDRAADRKIGRVYLSDERVKETLALAREHLAAAGDYIRALRSRRLRAACALPLLIGRETLDLVEKNPSASSVKITRGRVWLLLVRSLVY